MNPHLSLYTYLDSPRLDQQPPFPHTSATDIHTAPVHSEAAVYANRSTYSIVYTQKCFYFTTPYLNSVGNARDLLLESVSCRRCLLDDHCHLLLAPHCNVGVVPHLCSEKLQHACHKSEVSKAVHVPPPPSPRLPCLTIRRLHSKRCLGRIVPSVIHGSLRFRLVGPPHPPPISY